MSKKYHVSTTINGDEYEFLCEAQQSLLDVLRDELMLSGTKEGCGTGDCGACTVMVDGDHGVRLPGSCGRDRRQEDRDHRGHGEGRMNYIRCSRSFWSSTGCSAASVRPAS